MHGLLFTTRRDLSVRAFQTPNFFLFFFSFPLLLQGRDKQFASFSFCFSFNLVVKKEAVRGAACGAAEANMLFSEGPAARVVASSQTPKPWRGRLRGQPESEQNKPDFAPNGAVPNAPPAAPAALHNSTNSRSSCIQTLKLSKSETLRGAQNFLTKAVGLVLAAH